MTNPPVWVNGAFAGRIEPGDRGLLLGDGVFDTLVSFRGAPFAGDRHMARLVAHASSIGITLDPAEAQAGWDAIIGEAKDENVILRTTVTRGVTARGLWPKAAPPPPTIVVSATPWSEEIVGRPVRLITSAIVRNAGSPTSRLKTTNYLDNILAAREASENGADDALLLNASNHVACTTIANVFLLSNGRLATPPGADGAMAGIVRGLVMEIAGARGMQSAERSIDIAELFAADEVFLTNSVRLVSPVRSLDGRPIGGRDAPSVEALLASLAAMRERRAAR